MAGSLKGPHSEIPQETPAIVLSGEVIQRMSPERRLEVARSLGILLGVHAEVISHPVGQPDESETQSAQLPEEQKIRQER